MSGLIGSWSVVQDLEDEVDKLKRKVEVLERQSRMFDQRIKQLEDERSRTETGG